MEHLLLTGTDLIASEVSGGCNFSYSTSWCIKSQKHFLDSLSNFTIWSVYRGTNAHDSVCVLPDTSEAASHLYQRHQPKNLIRTKSLTTVACGWTCCRTFNPCNQFYACTSAFRILPSQLPKLLKMLIYLLTSCFIYCIAGLAAAHTYQAILSGSYTESVGKSAISPASKFSKCFD